MEETKIGFVLQKIVTDQFATLENVIIEPQNIQLSVGIDFGINEDHMLAVCFTRIQFIMNDLPFIIIHVNCEFGIEEKAWNKFIDIENNTITFPKGFMAHLAVITVGTTRGILHAKTENTKFNQYFLPTINVNELVKKDISFTLDNKQ